MKTLASSRKPGIWAGRIRQMNNSLEEAGIHEGDWIEVDLTKQPEQGELCAAFTVEGKLIVRYFHKEANGDIRLSRGPSDKKVKVFVPEDVAIFGRARKVVRDDPS
jgi:SOS-response transcriptional repressor LexA